MKSRITRLIALGATGLALAGWGGGAFANHINLDLNNPDGNYYVYSTETSSSLLSGTGANRIYDVDSYDNYIYANIGSGRIARWTVGLSGGTDPNLHPDNPDATGPMVARTFTDRTIYDTTIGQQSMSIGQQSTSEIYATEDTLYYRYGSSLVGYDLGTGTTSTVINSGIGHFLAYDDVNGVWYSGNESSRAVDSWDGTSWNQEFTYDSMAGSHMDGMEFVNGAMFVSDMTSDYILQATYNSGTGDWDKKNLFAYNDPTSTVVEGMGFGAFDHFWVGAGYNLIEIGGGKLQQEVTVAEPASLMLMGLGLAGLGFATRRRRNG